MAEYIPNYGDLDNFRYEPLIRTKSRAYQIACWQGYLGTHEFFLGRYVRGWCILGFTFLSVISAILEPVLGIPLIICVILLNIMCVRYIADTDPYDSLYGDYCGPIFHGIHMISKLSFLWGVNYWGDKTPTDPEDIYKS